MKDHKLPTDGFRWLSEESICRMDWRAQTRAQSVGYIVECDLSVPPELHERFSAMPLAQEKYTINESTLSEYSSTCRKLLGGAGARAKYKSEKLCGTFHEKKYFVLHYINLRHFLQLGLKLDKIHRVLAFNQRAFLHDYVELMTEKRKRAKSDFERRLYKEQERHSPAILKSVLLSCIFFSHAAFSGECNNIKNCCMQANDVVASVLRTGE